MVIFLFNPNLVGTTVDLLAVLLGDQASGRVGKLPRTLFVINRSDELGIDPHEDPAGYQNLCRRKELEFAQALGALHGEVHGGHGAVSAEQILCVASDPYGLIGDRDNVSQADYDQHRGWDGMDALRHGLTDTSGAQGRNGADVRILEGGAVILGDLVANRRKCLTEIEASARQRRLLLLDLDACLSAGRALLASGRDRLATARVAFVAQLFDEVAGTNHDDDLLAARVKQLENCANTPEAQQLYQEWLAEFVRNQEEWQEATSARIEARLTSAGFASAFPDTETLLDVEHLKPRTEPKVRGSDVAESIAKGAANASREGVTKAAHAFGHKFRPWGATKLTAKVNAAGGALGIAVGAFELYGVHRSVQRESVEEEAARDHRSASLRRVREATEMAFDGTKAGSLGITMAKAIDEIQRIRDDEAAQFNDAEAAAAALAQQADHCERRMRDALKRLETPEP